MSHAGLSKKLTIALLFVLLPACWLSNTGKGSSPSENPSVAQFTFGDEVAVVEQKIGPEGGTIVAPASSQIDGVAVTFPAGALAKTVSVSLATNTGSLKAAAGQPSNKSLVLHAGDIKQFHYPVLIQVARNDVNTLVIPYEVDANGRLHLAQLVELDRDRGRMSFYTFHASVWTWLTETWDGLTGGSSKPIKADTDYGPKSDGFQVSHSGPSVNAGSDCAGMTTFSLWYYMEHSSEGDLFGALMDPVTWDGQSVKRQDVIATRAESFFREVYGPYWDTIARNLNLKPAERLATIANAIANTGHPVPLALTNARTGRTVLAYSESGGEISVYDPTQPKDSRTITYDLETQSFESYEGYDGVSPMGNGSLYLAEPYGAILEDAKAGFHSTANAVLTVSSHLNHQSVVTGPVTLKGKIESGKTTVNKLKVTATQGATVKSGEAAVDAKGQFSVQVPIAAGENQLAFVTYGTKGSEVPNNLGANTFMLVGCPAAGCMNCCPPTCLLMPIIVECTVGGEPCLRCGAALGVTCGDKKCTTPSETCRSCAEDCGTCKGCGDAKCAGETGETCKNCPQDCGQVCPHCPDGTCSYKLGESCKNCPQDCDWSTCPVCGDGSCWPRYGETCSNCPKDCGECHGCGDGSCWENEGETCSNCPQDCKCPADGGTPAADGAAT